MRKTVVLFLFAILFCGAIAMAQQGVREWYIPENFPTLQAANDSNQVVSGDKIFLSPGNHAGALLTKQLNIKGIGATINTGPAHVSGLIMGIRLLGGSGGTTISHLTFTTDLSIMNGGAVDDVTVTQNIFVNSVQAVSNWRGRNWEITHNKIFDLRTSCGGGIGVLIGDYAARSGGVFDNLVSHNTIEGTLHVPYGDCGGYNGSGIVLYADYRWEAAGAEALKLNRIVKNKVAVLTDNQGSQNPVDMVAFEMTDTRDTPTPTVIYDNAVGFNDFRGTILQVVLTPSSLDLVNDISRNFGENRGKGLSPRVFKE